MTGNDPTRSAEQTWPQALVERIAGVQLDAGDRCSRGPGGCHDRCDRCEQDQHGDCDSSCEVVAALDLIARTPALVEAILERSPGWRREHRATQHVTVLDLLGAGVLLRDQAPARRSVAGGADDGRASDATGEGAP